MPASGIKASIHEYLELHRPACIAEAELEQLTRFLRSRLGTERKLSDVYLLRVLSEAGVEIARSLGGLPVDLRGRVHFRDRESAASSLLDLAGEYSSAREKDDRLRQQDCRRAVRHAKDRIKLHLRRAANFPKTSEPKKRSCSSGFSCGLKLPNSSPNGSSCAAPLRYEGPPTPRAEITASTWRTHSCVPCRHSWRHVFSQHAAYRHCLANLLASSRPTAALR